jgi:N utilization substance protein B
MLRHEARVLALQVLYEADTTQHGAGTVLERHLAEGSYDDKVREYARALVVGVMTGQMRLDDLIGKYALEYPVGQLSPVDRTILRMAIFESNTGDVPGCVIVNEAVELAKEFGSETSARFVNGVLGAAIPL